MNEKIKNTIKSIINLLETVDKNEIILCLNKLLEEENEENNSKIIENKTEYQQLIELLKSDSWPEAAPSSTICSDLEEDKLERAAGILEYFFHNELADKKFLDYGCGEGHVAIKSSEETSFSVGFDISKSGNLIWEEENNKYLLTTDFETIIKHAPYDVILLYDTLDHTSDPVDVLKKIKSLSNEKTKIHVRCHSWMSRHGSHIYKEINKAWVHLFFSEDELNDMGFKLPQLTQKYFKPIDTQKKWFKEAGLSIVFEDVVREDVESFFKNPILIPRIPKIFNGKLPEHQMGQSFNDYILKNV